MLDITKEEAIPLTDVAKCVPPRRRGKRTHISTILRWISPGSKAPDGERIRLEAVRVGGKWVTTREALQRFIRRLTPSFDENQSSAEQNPSDTASRAAQKAGLELDRIGIRPNDAT